MGLVSLSLQFKQIVNGGAQTERYILECNVCINRLLLTAELCLHTTYLLTISPQGNVCGAFDHIT